jgi:hypothetical protein
MLYIQTNVPTKNTLYVLCVATVQVCESSLQAELAI